MKHRLGLGFGAGARCASALAMATALVASPAAFAQDADPVVEEPAQDDARSAEIVVTGSRIDRAGFDQPTPTIVLGEDLLDQGARSNIQQALNDQPQFRPTVTPQVSGGNTSSGTAPVDLRGLGTGRTLTLINGRRFVGDNNLNFVPSNLIERVEVVTGGASAAWGSGAVAGVVNIILDDDLEGLTLGATTGLASRGDAMRYGFDGSFGTSFADGAGHFMIGAEYVNDEGILNRNSRPNLGSTGLAPAPGGVALVEDVNFADTSVGGVILSGVLAGQTFNPDGTLRPFRGPDARGVGGADGVNLYDYVVAATPFERAAAYARVSYDVGFGTIWADATYGRVISAYPFFPDFTIATGGVTPPLTIQASNPFLSQGIRDRLAAAGETSFTFNRLFAGPYTLEFDADRETIEGAIGIDGKFGSDWDYSAWFSHGEVDSNQQLSGSRLAANFGNAIDAVSAGGQIVCGINADADPTNDDPACAPINPFGVGNVSAEALGYTTGTQQSFSTSKLDSLGVEVQGDLIDLWAGPLTVAVGFESRWEELSGSRTPETLAGGFALPVFVSDLSGDFDVQEGFGEVALPLLDIDDAVTLDFNGAARYSDYSSSGGIWSWKLGGTARIVNDILLRVTRSRDIRSPSINELFSQRSINIGPVVDDPSLRPPNAGPGYNANPAQVTSFTGGNPDLVPETSSTLTFGGSISPSFVPGLSLSVDYYDIEIEGAIVALSRDAVVQSCAGGNQDACDRVIRDSNGTITTIFSGFQNVASFETSGIDFEVSYLRPLWNGNLRLRALANYVEKFVFDDGISRVDTAGDVGSSTPNAIPKWRANASVAYDADEFGTYARVRYVDGGKFNSALDGVLINNDIESRTYVDLGVRFRVADRFTLSGDVTNVFDVDGPLSPVGSNLYDIFGTYYTVSARVEF